MRALIALLVLWGATLEALAEGVVATGTASSGSAYFVTHDHDSRAAARALALSECRSSATDCQIVHEFTLSCVGIAQPRNAPLKFIHDPDRDSLNLRLADLCPVETPCSHHVWCDTKPVPVKLTTSGTRPAASLIQALYYGHAFDMTNLAAGAAVLLLLGYAVDYEIAHRRARSAAGGRTAITKPRRDQRPIRSPARVVDTAGAQDALRSACPYLEDYYSNKKATRTEDIDSVRMAARYIAEARAKDPEATIVYRNKDGDDITLTVNEMTAEILYLEAVQNAYNSDPIIRKTALAPLLQAVSYVPDNLSYRRDLARLYLNLDMKQEAIAAAKEILAQDPTDLETRRLVESIRPDDPKPQRARTFFNVGACFTVIGGGLGLASPFIAYTAQDSFVFLNIMYFGALPLLAVGRVMGMMREERRRSANIRQ